MPPSALCITLTLLGVAVIGRAAESPPGSDWPMYRHDGSLAGFSPLQGGLETAPQKQWSVELGGPIVPAEQVRIRDVNGDGEDEVLRLGPDRLICQDLRGRRLWEVTDLPGPGVEEPRDYAGDGSRGLVISSNTGVEVRYYMVNGATGRQALLYKTENVFGGSRRTGPLLPGVPGEQLCVWWSGENVEAKEGGARGHGYVWSFENGVDQPTLRFQATMDGVVYAPLHLFADMDGDGRTDMVVVSHEQMWLWDLETGQFKTHASWPPQIRSYSANVGAVPLRPGEPPSLLMINPHLPGVAVVTQDGRQAQRLWKQVVGGKEDQYQPDIKIGPGAPDPFVDLGPPGQSQICILAAVTNEHGDGRPHLVVFDAARGERLYDQANVSVLTVDDLDGDGTPEVLLRDGNALRIAHWNGSDFVDRGRSEEAAPLLLPAPPEGHRQRSAGNAAPGCNMPLWREQAGSPNFLLGFGDETWSCRLAPDGTLERLHRVTKHPALGNATEPAPRRTTYTFDGQLLVAQADGAEVARYEVPMHRVHLAAPPIVGQLGGEMRIVVREADGALISLSPSGKDRRVLVEKTPFDPAACICDLDGDGTNELVTSALDAAGRASVVVLDAAGKIKRRLEPIDGATETMLGPTGRLGPGRGRWVVVRYRRQFATTAVAAYEGATGQPLWRRDHFPTGGSSGETFVLHLPTAVYDYDGDGADDLLAFSENHYGIISVKDNRDLVGPLILTAVVPGHWGAYATPLVASILGEKKPQVFFCRAFALMLLTDLEGRPVWHYGLTRDTTTDPQAGLADLRGDGRLGIVVARRDGLIQCFDAEPQNQVCPTCPPGSELAANNHAGRIRWELRLKPPVSDLTAADLDDDGKAELLCGAGDGRLYALKEKEGAGCVLWSVDFGRRVGSPIVADVDGDQQPEILVTTEDGKLHGLKK